VNEKTLPSPSIPLLSILIEMHGGRIWFESSGIEGEGSVFSFTLPLE
jgi:signal transduction histidine kinase